MRKLIGCILLVLIVGGLAFAADAAAPPKYIWVQYVSVAGDKSDAYPKLVAQFQRAVDASKADVFWVATTNLTGDPRQANFISFFDNMGAVEKEIGTYDNVSVEAVKINPNIWTEMGAAEQQPHSIIAKFVPELSYRPEKVALSEAKWWSVTTIHLKPGHMTAFAELIKQEQELLKKADIDEHFLVYAVMAGLPTSGAAYYIIVPMKSLTEMDTDHSAQASTVFTPIVRRHFESAVEKMVSQIQSNLLMVRPNMSRPPKSFLAANPEFWTVKEPAPAVAQGKKAKKTTSEPGK